MKMQITLRQVETLLAFFGGANANMTVEYFPANHWPDMPTAPAGLYVYCTEYPEEGAQWLGQENNDESIEPTWQHIPPGALGTVPDVQATPDGWKLAMFVLQSDLYRQLPEEERAVCDALINDNPYIATAPQAVEQVPKVPAVAAPGALASLNNQLWQMKDRACRAHALCNELRMAHPNITELGDDGALHEAIHDILRVDTPTAAAQPGEQPNTLSDGLVLVPRQQIEFAATVLESGGDEYGVGAGLRILLAEAQPEAKS